jgi:hypothetical protein
MPPETAYWSAKDLAVYLGRSVKSVYKMPVAHPSMPCLRIGKTVMFPIERTKRWLLSQEQGRSQPRNGAVARMPLVDARTP